MMGQVLVLYLYPTLNTHRAVPERRAACCVAISRACMPRAYTPGFGRNGRTSASNSDGSPASASSANSAGAAAALGASAGGSAGPYR